MVNKKKNRAPKVNIDQFLRAILFFLIQFNYFARRVIWYPKIESILIGLVVMFSVIFFILQLKNRYLSKNIIGIIAVSAIVSLMIYMNSGDNQLLFIPAMLVFCIRNKGIKDIAKSDLIAKLLVVLVISLCYFTNNIDSYGFYRDGVSRITFGFHHPNALGFILAMIYVDIIILAFGKYNKALLVMVGAVLLYLSNLADSRTSMIAIVAIITIMLTTSVKLDDSIKEYKKAKKTFITISPLLFAIFSVIISNIYSGDNSFLASINTLFSNRLSLQAYYFDNFPITLFGQKIIMTEYPLDNAYLSLLFKFGVFGFSLVMLMYILSIRKMLSEKNRLVFRILLLLMIYALMESSPMRIIITPISICFIAKESERILHEK